MVVPRFNGPSGWPAVKNEKFQRDPRKAWNQHNQSAENNEGIIPPLNGGAARDRMPKSRNGFWAPFTAFFCGAGLFFGGESRTFLEQQPSGQCLTAQGRPGHRHHRGLGKSNMAHPGKKKSWPRPALPSKISPSWPPGPKPARLRLAHRN